MMPNFLHSFKAADEVKLARRRIMPILWLSIVVALLVSVYASLTLIYDKGALFLQSWSFVVAPRNYFQRMSSLIQYPHRDEVGRGVQHDCWRGVYRFYALDAAELCLVVATSDRLSSGSNLPTVSPLVVNFDRMVH